MALRRKKKDEEQKQKKQRGSTKIPKKSQASVVDRRVWQEDGSSASSDVPSAAAYYSKLVRAGSSRGIQLVTEGSVVVGNGVHQGVHDGVEHKHRQRITLEDTNLEMDGSCLPGLASDDTNQVLVKVGDHLQHLGGRGECGSGGMSTG